MIATRGAAVADCRTRRPQGALMPIRDRLLIDLTLGHRVRVRDWAALHGVSWKNVYRWLRDIETEGVLMIVLTTASEYVRDGFCDEDEIVDR